MSELRSEVRSVVARRTAVEPERSQVPAKSEGMLTSRTGGAYIPPARLKMMQDLDQGQKQCRVQRLHGKASKRASMVS